MFRLAAPTAANASAQGTRSHAMLQRRLFRPSRRPATRIFIKNPPRDLGNKWCKTAGGLLFFHAFHLVFTVYLLVLKGRFSIKNGYCFLTTLTVNTEYGEVLGWRRHWSSTKIWTFSKRETGETWNMLDSQVGSSVFRCFQLSQLIFSARPLVYRVVLAMHIKSLYVS